MDDDGPRQPLDGRNAAMSVEKIPDVSVVMSVYNGADTLAATVDSVLSQEGCDFEFVVVNDGSTDDSGPILDAYAALDGRLRVIHQTNTGLTRALVAGCAAARGEFIARQDAGDVSLPGRLCTQHQCMIDRLELAFVSAITRFLGPEGEYLYEQSGTGAAREPRSVIDLKHIHGVIDGPSHHGSVMFRTDAYVASGGYRPAFRFGQDWDLWYRLAERGQFMLLDKVLYQARVGLTDISVSNKRTQEQLARLSRRCLELRVTHLDETATLAEAAAIAKPVIDQATRTARGAYFVGECLRRNGDARAAARYFRTAIRNRPFQLRAWLRIAQTMFA